MPANPKFLSSGWVRVFKLLAVIFGAYLASILPFFAYSLNVKNYFPSLMTASYMVFIIWPALMIMIYLIRKVWISWMILLIVITVSLAFIIN